ncbi:MAG: hypothetical protein ACK2UC_13525 [Anaerolineae bacterium]|jgi:hypothetical protein
MKTNRTLVSILLLGLLLGLAIGPGSAQGPDQQVSTGPQAVLATAFTYQGQLTNVSGPVDDNCDFEFSLWDAAGSGEPPTGGSQIATTQTKTNVSVDGGLFTIPDLDFGHAAFTGDARWLQIAVRCPTGGGDYTSLAPRQALTAAPYALALPGLWTQQNGTSPNLIGGYQGNHVADGVVGATISGGGQSGVLNSVTESGGTVGGGIGNAASGEQATVGGGNRNLAGGRDATVAGGRGNEASGNGATVGGGTSNSASDNVSTVNGGAGNYATGWRATVSGGEGNIAGASSTIGGGLHNGASGWMAAIGGGEENEASGDYATVPGGREAAASHYGELAHASGSFSDQTAGTAQTSVYVLRYRTTSSTPAELFLDGYDDRLTVAAGRTMVFDILLVARSENDHSMGCTFQGVIENTDGTTAFVMAPGKLCQKGGLTWDANIVADDAHDALKLEVTGATGTYIRWVARVQTAEVSY